MSISYAVRNVMREDIVTVGTEATLGEAMNLMVDKNIGSVVVTRSGDMVGILTERDVMKRFCIDPGCASGRVEDVMSTPLVAVDGGESLGEAVNTISGKGIRRLLVTEEGKIRGIVTETDLMRATLEVFRKLSDAWV